MKFVFLKCKKTQFVAQTMVALPGPGPCPPLHFGLASPMITIIVDQADDDRQSVGGIFPRLHNWETCNIGSLILHLHLQYVKNPCLKYSWLEKTHSIETFPKPPIFKSKQLFHDPKKLNNFGPACFLAQ